MTEYIVTGRSNGTTRLGSPYCNLKVKNQKEEFSLAVWDVAPNDAPTVGQLVSFVTMQNNDGKRSAKRGDMRPGAMPDASHPLYALLPRPIERSTWDASISNLLAMCPNSPYSEIIADAADKLYQPYSQYPAASSIHHAFRGGLLNHVHQMLHMLEGIAPCMPYPIRVDHCALAILFHDYGKVQTYSREGEAQPEDVLLGHIYISAVALQRELERRSVPQDEVQRIVHIVLSHHGQKEWGSPVLPCSQEAMLVHFLDNLSAKSDTIEGSPDMEYVSALGTRVPKPKA